MDSSLLRQREDFKKRALAQPVVEKRKVPVDSAVNDAVKTKKKKKLLQRPTSSVSSLTASSTRGSRFGYLAQIVNFMKSKHQDDDLYALAIDEILEECKLENVVSISDKNWLTNEALPNNPKIQVVEDPGQERKFSFKPKFNIRDKKTLIKLLDHYDHRGKGGIMLEDIEESLPNSKRCLKAAGSKIIFITRPDKKQVLFYNDRTCEFNVDEEFQQLWRGVTLESVDENKIEEYLNQQGISSVQDSRKVTNAVKQRKKPVNRKRRFKMHNDHVAGVLKDYSETSK